MILAPMQGLTELLFRKAYEECFPGAIESAVSPFISLTKGNLSEALKKIDDVWPEANEGSIPVVPQILGKEPEEFVGLANRLADIGYGEVNWNMGCPMRAITGKHRGSGILPYPEEVEAVLEAVVPRIRTRLSVKVRLGLKSKEEIFKLIPLLNAYPLASVAVHPRLGRQQYTGVPDLEAYGEVLRMLHHPVIYNGDITTAADASHIMERFPQTKDIMVGRGVLYRPTLPIEIAQGPMSEEERQKEARRFTAHLMQRIHTTFPTERAAIRKTKEYWCLLWKGIGISEVEARRVLREEEYETVEKMIYDYVQ